MSDFLYDIGIEIFGAIITGAALYIFQEFRYCWILKRNFNGVFFDVYYKGVPEKKVRTVTLSVKGNRIFYSGEHIYKNSSEGLFEGELIMNIINFKIGAGIHHHNNTDKFNFPRVFIQDKNTIFIETSYLSNKDSQQDTWRYNQFFQAYVWKRNIEFNKK